MCEDVIEDRWTVLRDLEGTVILELWDVPTRQRAKSNSTGHGVEV